MVITQIKKQIKKTEFYSIFIDGEYKLSIHENSLLSNKQIRVDKVIDEPGLEKLAKIAASDRINYLAVRFAAMRSRSEREIINYLRARSVGPPEIDTILAKLKRLNLISDEDLTERVVDRYFDTPTLSVAKIKKKLIAKGVDKANIDKALSGREKDINAQALQYVINKKKNLAKYQDKNKFIRYLIGQGFNYEDIKKHLNG